MVCLAKSLLIVLAIHGVTAFSFMCQCCPGGNKLPAWHWVQAIIADFVIREVGKEELAAAADMGTHQQQEQLTNTEEKANKKRKQQAKKAKLGSLTTDFGK